MAKHHERYWTQFCDYLEQRGSQLQPTASRNGHVLNFKPIVPNVRLRVRQVITDGGVINVTFFMVRSARAYYPQFHQQKAEIENKIGGSLCWEEDRHKESRISLIRTDMNSEDEADWAEQHEWLASTLEKFEAVFRPRIE